MTLTDPTQTTPTDPGNIAIVDRDEYVSATTRTIGRRTFVQPIELPSGTLTGEPNVSGDGSRVALCYPWTEEDRVAIWEMFLTLVWAEVMPVDWDTAQFAPLSMRAPTA
ncbi:hypothetical protein [Deinococcus sp. JMULE3]|uniref:hypothetical protein n=1 Tax=Deinococcus sp. JMULE3 TaxID=2518341 RepID=UPI001576C62C|nr:hypothetical protein [Deinococcus sp. JMULE3]NTX99295.1 hypothetical protein [Deinococcus sp. JMULE3]